MRLVGATNWRNPGPVPDRRARRGDARRRGGDRRPVPREGLRRGQPSRDGAVAAPDQEQRCRRRHALDPRGRRVRRRSSRARSACGASSTSEAGVPDGSQGSRGRADRCLQPEGPPRLHDPRDVRDGHRADGRRGEVAPGRTRVARGGVRPRARTAEAWLEGMHIPPYEAGDKKSHLPVRRGSSCSIARRSRSSRTRSSRTASRSSRSACTSPTGWRRWSSPSRGAGGATRSARRSRNASISGRSAGARPAPLGWVDRARSSTDREDGLDAGVDVDRAGAAGGAGRRCVLRDRRRGGGGADPETVSADGVRDRHLCERHRGLGRRHPGAERGPAGEPRSERHRCA